MPNRVHYPLAAQPTFADLFEDDPFRPPFAIALLSCQWIDPAPTGDAVFTITVQQQDPA